MVLMWFWFRITILKAFGCRRASTGTEVSRLWDSCRMERQGRPRNADGDMLEMAFLWRYKDVRLSSPRKVSVSGGNKK